MTAHELGLHFQVLERSEFIHSSNIPREVAWLRRDNSICFKTEEPREYSWLVVEDGEGGRGAAPGSTVFS